MQDPGVAIGIFRGAHHESRRDYRRLNSDQYEYPGPAGPQRGQLERSIPQPLIFSKDYPPAGPDVAKPHPVFLIAVKMVIVDLNRETGTHEFCSDGFYAQRSVNEKDRSFRRLRSGWLPRRHRSPT